MARQGMDGRGLQVVLRIRHGATAMPSCRARKCLRTENAVAFRAVVGSTAHDRAGIAARRRPPHLCEEDPDGL